ncbi:hypothetical protein FVEG_17383 [Fusarium verticillioides 7600]|uniref:Uncharacterized protein n=1 Tax=Gibberella moniliformis (strain M3125 / FGSC 7600) TaxID=334819 RepID=W7N514_GIBM7|nr:hypothetical protein FVEG_17383 [Fusarium verticillioides 7600]EWG54734.1 hypothetical protein FVEG_17383 [Fusarium verticillioides 7600]
MIFSALRYRKPTPSSCLVTIAYDVDRLGPTAITLNDRHNPLGPTFDFAHWVSSPSPSPRLSAILHSDALCISQWSSLENHPHGLRNSHVTRQRHRPAPCFLHSVDR